MNRALPKIKLTPYNKLTIGTLQEIYNAAKKANKDTEESMIFAHAIAEAAASGKLTKRDIHNLRAIGALGEYSWDFWVLQRAGFQF